MNLNKEILINKKVNMIHKNNNQTTIKLKIKLCWK